MTFSVNHPSLFLLAGIIILAVLAQSVFFLVQCSDSRHYGPVSNHVYRFSAMDLTAEERGAIHGNNERIRTEVIGRAVEFYIRLMSQC